MMLMLAVFSLGAYAQTQQGQSAVGFNIGYGFDSKNATLGVDYRYCITDAVRLSPSLTYFVKNDNHSTWAIDLNAHYVVKLSEMFGFYPLVCPFGIGMRAMAFLITRLVWEPISV